MKRLAILAGLLLLACNAFGQAVNCNGATGHVVLGSGPAYVDCGSAPAPPPPIPTPTPNPVPSGQCSPAQTSYTGLVRQCSGAVYWPSKPANNYNGNLVSLDTVMRGTWGRYIAASGQPFTISIPGGQYVSLALTATDAAHGLQLGVNETFGQPGHIWLSDLPGGAPRSSVYGICEGTASASLLIYPFASYKCSITVGQTVYVNWSAEGDARPVSYTLY